MLPLRRYAAFDLCAKKRYPMASIKVMLGRFPPPVLCYVVGAVLLTILWFEIPFLNVIAGLLQLPAAAWALSVPPPELDPSGKRNLFVFMFLVQGFYSALLLSGFALSAVGGLNDCGDLWRYLSASGSRGSSRLSLWFVHLWLQPEFRIPPAEHLVQFVVENLGPGL